MIKFGAFPTCILTMHGLLNCCININRQPDMELLPVMPLENHNHGEWSKGDEGAHRRRWLCPPASQSYPRSGTFRALSQMSSISKPRLCLAGDENPVDINLPDTHLKYNQKISIDTKRSYTDFSPN